MTQQRPQLAYRWQYHALNTSLGLLALVLTIVGRRRRTLQQAAAADAGAGPTELLVVGPERTVRPVWADRLLTERAVLRIAVSGYLTYRAYQLGRSSQHLAPSEDGDDGARRA